MENITKDSIAEHLSDRIGLSKRFFTDVVSTVFEEMVNLALLDSKLKIKNFGSFNISKKNSRHGNVIGENKKIDIGERLVLTFSPSRSLKERMNKIS